MRRGRNPVKMQEREQQQTDGPVVHWQVEDLVRALDASPALRRLVAERLTTGRVELEQRVARLEAWFKAFFEK